MVGCPDFFFFFFLILEPGQITSSLVLHSKLYYSPRHVHLSSFISLVCFHMLSCFVPRPIHPAFDVRGMKTKQTDLDSALSNSEFQFVSYG